MTTTLLAPAPPKTLARRRGGGRDTIRSVEHLELRIASLPRGARVSVEKLMLLLPAAEEAGEVWFTRWRRDADGTYSCAERIDAPEDAVAEFSAGLKDLAGQWGFVARLERRTYHGDHG